MDIKGYDVTLRYAVLLCTVLLACASLPSYQGDDCDWIGSGLRSLGVKRGVQPIYLRCSQGRVQWHYPNGALRVVLRHGTSGRDFRGCIRLAKNSTGARIYLEGRRKLHPIYSKGDGRPIDLMRCFTSTNGQVALYVESEPIRDQLRKEMADFSYDLQTVSRKSLVDPLEECRPCTEQEILQFYCTSDFVIGGTVSSLFHHHELQISELTIRIAHLIRDGQRSIISSPGSYFIVKGPVDSANYTTLHRPLKCGTKSGSGEYLFMGRWMLDNPTVHCAPRYSQWKKIRRKSLLEGTNQCQID